MEKSLSLQILSKKRGKFSNYLKIFFHSFSERSLVEALDLAGNQKGKGVKNGFEESIGVVMESGRVKAFHPKERREGEASERFFDTQSVLDKLEIQIFFQKKAEGKFYFPTPAGKFFLCFSGCLSRDKEEEFSDQKFLVFDERRCFESSSCVGFLQPSLKSA